MKRSTEAENLRIENARLRAEKLALQSEARRLRSALLEIERTYHGAVPDDAAADTMFSTARRALGGWG